MSLLLFHLLIIVASSETTTKVGDLYATIDPNIESILLTSFLPSGYDLPTNLYEWNVSEMVYLINQKDPEIMYIVDTELLFTVFPEYFISQLPSDILIAHELYYYLPTTKNNTNCANTTNCTMTKPPITKIDPCFGPFVHTKYDGVFTFPNGSRTFQCALRCEHTQILWNLTDDEMYLIDICWWFCSGFFLFASIIIMINISMDIYYHKQRCCQREFLFHSPIFIVIGYTIISLSFLIPLIVGKGNITCENDINGVKTFGSYNPGGSTVCTVGGIFFYCGMMMVGGYTTTFSLSLWSQFFAPLNSVADELKDTPYCKCCCNILGSISNPFSSFSLPSSRFFSKSALRHYAIWIIVTAYTISGISERAIQAAPVLGLCTIGTRHKTHTIKYNIVPFSIFLGLTSLFLPCAIILLVRVAKRGNTETKAVFKKLKWRLLVFFLFVLEAWFTLVFVLGFIFHVQRPKFEEAAEIRTKCMMIKSGTGQSYDGCLEGFTYWYGWYIFAGLSMPFTGTGSLILSCNAGNYRRWKVIGKTIISCGRDKDIFKRLAEVVSSSKSGKADLVLSKSGSGTTGSGAKRSKGGTATSGSKGSKGSKAIGIELQVHVDPIDSQKQSDGSRTPNMTPEPPRPMTPEPQRPMTPPPPNVTPEPPLNTYS